MYLAVKSVKSLPNYKLLLTFENNETRHFDMNPYLDKGVFKELRDSSLFYTVKVNFDSVEWVNEADLDPEFLYEESDKYES